METKVETLEDNKVKVSVTVDAKEVDDRIAREYKNIANKYNFPGFRKGKAPRPVIDNAIGKEAILATVTDEVVNNAYPLAIEEIRIYPISKPQFDDPELAEGGKPFDFSFTVEVKPEVMNLLLLNFRYKTLLTKRLRLRLRRCVSIITRSKIRLLILR